MADEPTLGEIGRGMESLRRAMEALANKVLTVEVWKAEREAMEFRIRETEKDIANLDAEARSDRKQREQEKAAADIRAASARRQVLLAVVTSFVLPVLVAIVLSATLKG